MEKEEKKIESESETEEDEEKVNSMLLKSNEAAERLETATKDMKLQLDRKERLLAESALGGESEAGTPPPTEKEQTKAKAEEMFKGTGMNPFAGEGENALY